MTCKNCGTEISDKALICFRCGASTFEPPPQAGPRPRRTRLLPTLLTLAILIVAALYLTRATVGDRPRVLGLALLALALILVIWRFVRRRR